MDRKITNDFTRIIKLANIHFQEIQSLIDTTPKRAILKINALYKNHKILITELYSNNHFKYRYYVLENNFIKAGFDNASDPHAIRLKYGKIGEEHSGELIPHLHLENKQKLVLTEEMNFDRFLDWLINNI